MNLLVDSWWYIYSNQGIGFMSPFLFSCQFMSVNLLIYSQLFVLYLNVQFYDQHLRNLTFGFSTP